MSDLVVGRTSLWKLTDPLRYLIILRGYAKAMLQVGLKAMSPAACLLVIAILRREALPKRWNNTCVAATTLALVGFGEFFVYVLTHWDLQWHIDTSLQRVLLQLWPAALWLMLLHISTPQPVDLRSVKTSASEPQLSCAKA
jgi:hypothetical protein